ncbi:UNVERIFIED_CONTAM: hypothetical protein Sindi_0172900, partial [Sesamum indicum]
MRMMSSYPYCIRRQSSVSFSVAMYSTVISEFVSFHTFSRSGFRMIRLNEVKDVTLFMLLLSLQ